MASSINASTSGAGGVITTADSSGVLNIQTAGTTAVTVDASQNVGIGTSSPAYTLDVKNASDTTLSAASTGASSSAKIRLVGRDTSVDKEWNIVSVGAGLGSNGLRFVNGSWTNSPSAWIDGTNNFYINSGYGSAAITYGCRAWVNFNGTGTVAIRASGNVSSITDNGTGDYTVNFTSAMPDANYGVSHAYSRETDCFTGNIATNNATGVNVAPTTSAIRVVTNGGAGLGGKDVSYVNVAVFR